MPNEGWARSQDGSIELSPVLDWEMGLGEGRSDGILRIWFQVGREQYNEDVQLQLSPVQVKDLRAALARLEAELAEREAGTKSS